MILGLWKHPNYKPAGPARDWYNKKRWQFIALRSFNKVSDAEFERIYT